MKKNILTPNTRKESYITDCPVDSVPIYQYGDTTTTDINLADKMPDGKPIQLGYSDKEFLPIPYPENKVSFNPAYPDARLRAMQLRSNLNSAISSGNIYLDKFEAVKFANDSINALSKTVNNINNTKNV